MSAQARAVLDDRAPAAPPAARGVAGGATTPALAPAANRVSVVEAPDVGSPAWRRLRPWVGAAVVALALLTLVTMVAGPMPAEHHVAVPIATALIAAAWLAELAGLRWPRVLFAAAAVAPNVALAAIGHVSANFLFLLLLAAWVAYTGTRGEGLAGLGLSLAPLRWRCSSMPPPTAGSR